ncbi:hypothetical protein IIA79_03255 [bacterium]|nr:hypothetical protein [bacterium]
MMKTHNTVFMVCAMLALGLSLAACGGGNSGAQFSEEPTLAGDTFMGIIEGDFKAVRYNDAGYRDSALNATFDLQTVTSGATTTVTVLVNDADPMFGAALDLHYDVAKYSPVDIGFATLIEDPLELAVTRVSGLVALAQVDAQGAAVRKGEFATVTFLHEPMRQVSAVGDPHDEEVNFSYAPTQVTNGQEGFVVTKSTAEAGNPCAFMIYSIFALGDGNNDSETNVGDLTPMVSFGNYQGSVSDANYSPAATDYDGNSEVNIADLTPIGIHLGSQTTGIEILLGDDPNFDATDAALSTIPWGDPSPDPFPPATGATDWADVFGTWNGNVTMDELIAADTNTDGTLFVSARTVNSATGNMGPSFTGLPLTYIPPPEGFTLGDFIVQIVNSDNGTGGDTYGADGTAEVVANSSLTLNISEFSGNYDDGDGPQPFSVPDDLESMGGFVPDANYDEALIFYGGNATWTEAVGGASGFRSSNLDGGVLSFPGGTMGTGLAADVFPDDDPESVAAMPEATLTVGGMGTLPDRVLGIDVVADLNASEFDNVGTDQGAFNGDWYLSVANNTVVTQSGMWGAGGAPGTIDGTTVGAQLFNFNNPGDPLALNFVPLAPADPGDFSILDAGDGTFALSAIIASNVSQGSTYTVRFMVTADGVYNSVNKPGSFLVVAPPPAPVELGIAPNLDLSAGDNVYQIMHADPMMRRDPRVAYGLDDNLVITDQEGYDDLFKSTGNAFAVGSNNLTGGEAYPQITFLEAPDHTGIDASTEGQVGSLVLQSFLSTLVVDIQGFPDPDPPDGQTTWSFMVFGDESTPGDKSTRLALGYGTFTINALDVGAPPLSGVAWGINIFDSGAGRGSLELGDRDFSLKTVSIDTLGDIPDPGAFPDIFFVEFSGGNAGPMEIDLKAKSPITCTFTETDGVIPAATVNLEIRAVGTALNDLPAINFLGVHPFGPTDIYNPGLGFGFLVVTENYDLELNDELDPGAEPLTGQLFCGP